MLPFHPGRHSNESLRMCGVLKLQLKHIAYASPSQPLVSTRAKCAFKNHKTKLRVAPLIITQPQDLYK